MLHIDKWKEAIEKDISGVDNISCFKIDKAVTIGMGMWYMNGMDGIAVEISYGHGFGDPARREEGGRLQAAVAVA